jgi:hypothetical protein
LLYSQMASPKLSMPPAKSLVETPVRIVRWQACHRPAQAVEIVFEAVDQFVNGITQFDDITCVALRCYGVNSRPALKSDSVEIQ